VTNPLADDLDHVLSYTQVLWEELRGGRLFITGGTGFFGCWLLESLAWANDRLGLGAEAVVLTRDPAAFARKSPRIASRPDIRLHAGDVRSFTFPEGIFTHVIHAATETTAQPDTAAQLALLDTIVQGTRRTLDFARQSGKPKVLLTSSGGVYGRQPPDLTHLPEEYAGAPDPLDPRSAYGEGKRIAEYLATAYHDGYGLPVKIARCFAFVGPYLALDAHFAVGNFLRDGLRGGPVQVGGDGTPYRSYLYAADLAVWLWTLLFRGESCRPYNVGSDESLTIADLARRVATVFGVDVRVARAVDPGRAPDRYVPAIRRACDELGLRVRVPLDDALSRTARFARVTRPEIAFSVGKQSIA
jgi:nucleoside-diphosphate-sugar epimerase